MADSIHMAVASFRDTVLTAVARLEFQLRDTNHPLNTVNINSTVVPMTVAPGQPSVAILERLVALEQQSRSQPSGSLVELRSTMNEILHRLDALEQKNVVDLTGVADEVPVNIKQEILEIQEAPSTRNVIVVTPALMAAVASANAAEMAPLDLSQDQPPSDEEEEEEEEEAAAEGDVEEEEEEESELKPLTLNGKQYFVDAENSIYVETEEGYEEIGKYDPATQSILLDDEEGEEEEEEEEEENNLEPFRYKGVQYYKDAEGTVYVETDEGYEEAGSLVNGKLHLN